MATGSPTPESFDDPYPVSSTGQEQFLASTRMVQSDDARIVSQAQSSSVAGTTTEAAAVENIMGFVKERVSDNSNSDEDAVATLLAGTGDCVNRANLALALLRASGIPARFVSGIVSDQMYRVDFKVGETSGWIEAGWYNDEAHAWIEVYYPGKTPGWPTTLIVTSGSSTSGMSRAASPAIPTSPERLPAGWPTWRGSATSITASFTPIRLTPRSPLFPTAAATPSAC